MSSNEEFSAKLDAGDIGELFFAGHFGSLSRIHFYGGNIITGKDNTIEGDDGQATVLTCTGELIEFEVPFYASGEKRGYMANKVQARCGFVEVKSSFMGSIISFSHNGEVSVAFELDENVKHTEDEWHYDGWLPKTKNPDKFNDLNGRIVAVKPAMMVFLYYPHPSTNLDQTPFLSIAFMDYPKLLKVIKQLWVEKACTLSGNMVLFPLSRLKDAGEVVITAIGEWPEISWDDQFRRKKTKLLESLKGFVNNGHLP